MPALYKDLNQFTPQTRQFSEDARAVYQSVYNIISTRKGERLFNVNFGINLEDELFELNDEETQDRIKTAISSGISEYEPRVTLDLNATKIEVNEDSYQIQVTIVFSIQGIEGQTFQIVELLSR